MQEVVLVIHLLLAVTIIGLVLLQRSSGGGLGIGGSGGLGDFASARSTANALTKATTICAFLFFATSLTLAVIAKGSGERKGLLDSYSTPAAAAAPAMPAAPEGTAPAEMPAPAPAATAPAAVTPAPVAPVTTPEPPVSTE